jgi:hypothetical protein
VELSCKNREKCFCEESDKNVAVTFFIYDLTKEQEQLLKGEFSSTLV